jgi:hypothetical protein
VDDEGLVAGYRAVAEGVANRPATTDGDAGVLAVAHMHAKVTAIAERVDDRILTVIDEGDELPEPIVAVHADGAFDEALAIGETERVLLDTEGVGHRAQPGSFTANGQRDDALGGESLQVIAVNDRWFARVADSSSELMQRSFHDVTSSRIPWRERYSTCCSGC